MLASSGSAAFFAGIGTAGAGAILVLGKRVLRWAGEHAKVAFKATFAEAVDDHVEPKFVTLREETTSQAQQVRDELVAHRDEVLQALIEHTEQEGAVVAKVVKAEVAPLAALYESHIANDAASFERVDERQNTMEQSLARIEDTVGTTTPDA